MRTGGQKGKIKSLILYAPFSELETLLNIAVMIDIIRLKV